MHSISKACAWVALTLLVAAAPLQAAPKPTVQQQLEALQKTLDAQQAQLVAQQQQIEAQQAQIAVLQARQGEAPKPDVAVAQQQAQIDKLAQAAAQSKVAMQDQPKVSIANNRMTVTSADGRSSIALRALVQADVAHYSQDSAGPLDTDFRRGSVGATANRDVDGARDLSDGAYFRRARFGFEGVINRNFNYKLLLELGGAGTEGPTRINDAWIAYNGFAPFTLQMGAFAPSAGLADSTTPDDLLFIERPSSAELARAMGGADGRLGLALRASGARWMSSLALTSRTVNDPEVNDSQSALVGRVGGLMATNADFNVHVGANGTYIIHPADQGPSATSGRYGLRFRERPELRGPTARA